MRVFRLNEYDFVYAESKEQAIEYYMNETGLSLEEAFDEHYYEELDLDKGVMWISADDLEDKDKAHGFKQFGNSLYAHVTYDYVIKRFNLEAPYMIATTEW